MSTIVDPFFFYPRSFHCSNSNTHYRRSSRLFTRSVTLQDMCLVAVIRDIDFFVSNETIPQRHLDFLFRKYSDEIISKYKLLKKSPDEDIMLWFLNPHVKKVTLTQEFHSERIMQQLKAISSGITSLNLKKSNISENELNSIICGMPHVVQLNLSHTSCSDETLAYIQKFCPKLESLNIAYCDGVTDSGLGKLSCNSELPLRTLNLLCTQVSTFAIVVVLNRLPSLECVKFENMPALLHEIANKRQYDLTELKFTGSRYRDDHQDLKIFQAVVKTCPKLKILHLETSVNEKVLNICAHFQNLKELKLSFKNYNGPDVLASILPLSQNLKSLILSYVKICPINLVNSFKNLEYLFLKEVSFIPFEQKDVKIENTKLHTLVIKDMYFSDLTSEAVILLISLSKNASKLYFKRINFFPTQLFDVIRKSMQHLTFIDFDFTFVDMMDVFVFFNNPTITTLIANTSIGTRRFFRSSMSCTLSWRLVRELDSSDDYSIFDDEEEDDEDNDDNKYFYKNRFIEKKADMKRGSHFSDSNTSKSWHSCDDISDNIDYSHFQNFYEV